MSIQTAELKTVPLKGISSAIKRPTHVQGETRRQLSIIKVNDTRYIKGVCTNQIVDNTCTGNFTSHQVVDCSGDPLFSISDFEKCTRAPGEYFGRCVGTTSSDGCRGRYFGIVKVDDKIYSLKAAQSDVHFDFYKIHGASKLKTILKSEGKIVTHHFFCYESFDLRTAECNHGIYKTVRTNHELVGVYTTTSLVCESIFRVALEDKFSCPAEEMTTYECVGKSHFDYEATTKTKRYTCLGNLVRRVCQNGGGFAECNKEDGDANVLICKQSFFDGEICLNDKPHDNSKIKIEDQGRATMLSHRGKQVIVHKFLVDSFVMYDGFAESGQVSDSILDKVHFTEGRPSNDNGFTGLDLPSTATPVSFTEGYIDTMKFKDFQLDELPYLQFCTDTEADIIQVTFESITINNFFVQNLDLKNVVVADLEVNGQKYSFHGMNEEKIQLGFGTIVLKNVVIYLPYISKERIDRWRSGDADFLKKTVAIPRVDGIEVPSYILKFDRNGSPFLEFRTWEIKNKALDRVAFDDYVMENEKFTSNPEAASTIAKKYKRMPVPDSEGTD